jgi:predicted amidohydrolase
MNILHIAAAQFEHRDGDKAFNLSRIHALSRQAVAEGADLVSFHECCISAYSFVQPFSREQLLDLAEPVPDGASIRELMRISADVGVPLLAGLFEREGTQVFNTYVCVDGAQLVARFRKLHAFVNPHLSSGSEYVLFELRGWKCSILICYDNNLPENVRIATLMGAEVIFMPHVTGCLPSPMPGRGLVSPELWARRETDPVPLRQELQGPKGRGWLMRWLPARAFENGIYAVFTNPIGMDYGQVRNGNAMVLDPFGEVLAECHRLGDDVCLATCLRQTLTVASGRRYLRARRPDLYGKLFEPPVEPPQTLPGWSLQRATADGLPVPESAHGTGTGDVR